MKKYITIILTLATLAACTKSEVTYKQPGAIAIQPVSQGMTKAAVTAVPTGQELLIYANYVEPGKSDQYAGDPYLNAAVFEESSTGIWTGKGQTYFWPKSGTISLAGCTNYGTVEYSYEANTFTVDNYVQSLDPSNTVDFIWFGKTQEVNHDLTTNNLAVTMNHALTWVTIQVKGFGGSVGWNVEYIKLLGVKNTGSLTCKMSDDEVPVPVAEWDVNEEASGEFTVFQAPEEDNEKSYVVLTDSAQDIENTEGGTVLVPQTPVMMEVGYHTTATPGEGTLRTKTLDLKISETAADNKWEAGKHYIYTVTFNPYKITFELTTDDSWENTGKTVDDYDDDEIDGNENTPTISNK